MTFSFNIFDNIPNWKDFMNECCISNILTLKKVETTNNNYSIICYDKNLLDKENILHEGLFRSVVLNNNDKVICFSPPKSLSSDYFFELFPSKTNSIIAEEFVEGTMINLFWEPTLNDWEISTKHTVGGEIGFYIPPIDSSKKSFKTMFYEAVSENKLVLYKLPKHFSYSFVLQHPDNRIVSPIPKPQLYLIDVYNIVQKEENIKIRSVKQDIQDIIDFSQTTLKLPQIFTEWTTYLELIDKYASSYTEYNVQGIIFKNIENGMRTKVRNPNYEMVRQLRGNQPKLQYQYLILRKEENIMEFLQYYPEYKKDFFHFRKLFHTFTNILYKNYVSCYIRKEKPLIEFSEHYRTHMFHIHKIYLEELKPQGENINYRIVINYVNNMHLSLQMIALNHVAN